MAHPGLGHALGEADGLVHVDGPVAGDGPEVLAAREPVERHGRGLLVLLQRERVGAGGQLLIEPDGTELLQQAR